MSLACPPLRPGAPGARRAASYLRDYRPASTSCTYAAYYMYLRLIDS
jgi:hypothetical protein